MSSPIPIVRPHRPVSGTARRKGFAIKDFLFALALVLAAISTVLLLMRYARERLAVAGEVRFLVALTEDLTTVFRGQGNFAGLNNAVAYSVARDSRRKSPPNSIRSDLGGSNYTFQSAQVINPNDAMEITVTIPRVHCGDFVSSLSPTYEFVRVDSTVVRNVLPGNNTEMSTAALTTACDPDNATPAVLTLRKLLIASS